MLRYIELLRKKPVHIRAQVAFFGAVLITGGIALIWGGTLPARFSEEQVVTEEASPGQLSGTVGTLRTYLGGLMADFQDSVQNAELITSSDEQMIESESGGETEGVETSLGATEESSSSAQYSEGGLEEMSTPSTSTPKTLHPTIPEGRQRTILIETRGENSE